MGCLVACTCRATIAEISRENEFSILYGLVSTACNIALSVAQYVTGLLSKSSSSDVGAQRPAHNHTLSAFGSVRVRDDVYQHAWWFLCSILALGCFLSILSFFSTPKQHIEREKSRSFDEVNRREVLFLSRCG